MKQRILILEEDGGDTTTLFDYTLKPGEVLVLDMGDQGDAYDCSYVITVDRTKNSEPSRVVRGPRDQQKH